MAGMLCSHCGEFRGFQPRRTRRQSPRQHAPAPLGRNAAQNGDQREFSLPLHEDVPYTSLKCRVARHRRHVTTIA